jgi:telomerase Cajal body protein 1
LYSLEPRHGKSNQRIAFDIEPCGRHLVAGGTDGSLRMYDLTDGSLKMEWVAAKATVGGVSIHPGLPLVMSASGHRRFADGGFESDSEADEGCADTRGLLGCNELAVWLMTKADL